MSFHRECVEAKQPQINHKHRSTQLFQIPTLNNINFDNLKMLILSKPLFASVLIYQWFYNLFFLSEWRCKIWFIQAVYMMCYVICHCQRLAKSPIRCQNCLMTRSFKSFIFGFPATFCCFLCFFCCVYTLYADISPQKQEVALKTLLYRGTWQILWISQRCSCFVSEMF